VTGSPQFVVNGLRWAFSGAKTIYLWLNRIVSCFLSFQRKRRGFLPPFVFLSFSTRWEGHFHLLFVFLVIPTQMGGECFFIYFRHEGGENAPAVCVSFIFDTVLPPRRITGIPHHRDIPRSHADSSGDKAKNMSLFSSASSTKPVSNHSSTHKCRVCQIHILDPLFRRKVGSTLLRLL
jgi:hypothetical protein